jgi:hypothetical protein
VQDTTVIIRVQDTRQDTGRVGSGDMKINEFANLDNNELNFDLVDDTIVFMRNDPMFYRKHYFPAISKMADMYRAGNKFDSESIIMPVIEKACDAYVQKFNLGKLSDELFTQDDRVALLNRIYTEEMKEINKGEYQ